MRTTTHEIRIAPDASEDDLALAAALIAMGACEAQGPCQVAVPAEHADRVAQELEEMFELSSELAALFGGRDVARVLRSPCGRGLVQIRIEIVPASVGAEVQNASDV